MFAETVQLDGGAMAIILACALIALAIVILGYVFGYKAGMGSEKAFAAWVFIVASEGALCLYLLPIALPERTNPFVLIPFTILALHLGVDLITRRRARVEGDSGGKR
ncbi:MAG TPA: hypothetical protein VM121_05005 [Acidimicrobiales bacterium]|nr:hypothetical protein [Acidimicrobiales bacterium]